MDIGKGVSIRTVQTWFETLTTAQELVHATQAVRRLTRPYLYKRPTSEYRNIHEKPRRTSPHSFH